MTLLHHALKVLDLLLQRGQFLRGETRLAGARRVFDRHSLERAAVLMAAQLALIPDLVLGGLQEAIRLIHVDPQRERHFNLPAS